MNSDRPRDDFALPYGRFCNLEEGIIDFGERTLKQVGSTTTHYVFPFYERAGTQENDYVVMDGVRIAKRQGGTTTFFHQDHLGSDNVLTTSTGAKITANEYLPFGEFPSAPPVGSSGPRYTGQYYDEESGLYYYGARYYNPSVGRFLSADSLIGNPFDSQSFNRFSYVGNNPVNFVDPSGNVMQLTNTQLDSYSFGGLSNASVYNSQQTTILSLYGGDGIYGTPQVSSNQTTVWNVGESPYTGQMDSLKGIAVSNAMMDDPSKWNPQGNMLSPQEPSTFDTVSSFVPQIKLAGGVVGLGKFAVLGMAGATKGLKKIFVIGEAASTSRIKDEALKIGGKFYEARADGYVIGFAKALRNNYQAMRRRFLQGYKLKDIGLHPKAEFRGQGKFYPWEQKWKKLWGWK